MNDYNFPVELTPVVTQPTGILIPKKLAVVRTDTNETLGVVSDKYGLLKHETVIDYFRNQLQHVKFEEKIKLMKNGAYLFATYRLISTEVEIKKGDIVSLQFIVKNSYNGMNSLQVSLGAFRLVCSNGMVIGKEFFSFSQRHIMTNGSINTNLFSERIPQLSDQFTNALPTMQAMNNKVIENSDELFKNKVLPKYINKEAKEAYAQNGDNTVWGFYNSLTQVITHKLRKQNPAVEIYFGRVAWEYATSIIR